MEFPSSSSYLAHKDEKPSLVGELAKNTAISLGSGIATDGVVRATDLASDVFRGENIVDGALSNFIHGPILHDVSKDIASGAGIFLISTALAADSFARAIQYAREGSRIKARLMGVLSGIEHIGGLTATGVYIGSQIGDPLAVVACGVTAAAIGSATFYDHIDEINLKGKPKLNE